MDIEINEVQEIIKSLESGGELSIKEEKYLNVAKMCVQLAAENVAMRKTLGEVVYSSEEVEHDGCLTFVVNPDCVHDAADLLDGETTTTDRIVAGIKADGRAEGVNFAASRLAAAFNHGFVDKPMAEVGDVVRMILTAKEDLAKDPVLAADGLSGEYAKKSLAEWEAALSDGASYD